MFIVVNMIILIDSTGNLIRVNVNLPLIISSVCK